MYVYVCMSTYHELWFKSSKFQVHIKRTVKGCEVKYTPASEGDREICGPCPQKIAQITRAGESFFEVFPA